MSHTNSTTHYNLPQFVGTDTPGWLTDVNAAMSGIDTAIYQRQTDIAANTSSITQNTAAITTANTRIDTLASRMTSAEEDINTAGASITALQTTSAQHTADIASLATRVTNLSADDISYDDSGSAITANDIQTAINMLLPVTLFNTDTYDSGTLIESIENYKRIKIFYHSEDGHYNCIEIYTNGSAAVIVSVITGTATGTNMIYYGKSARIRITDGTALQIDRGANVNIRNGQSAAVSENLQAVRVNRIEGYKY